MQEDTWTQRRTTLARTFKNERLWSFASKSDTSAPMYIISSSRGEIPHASSAVDLVLTLWGFDDSLALVQLEHSSNSRTLYRRSDLWIPFFKSSTRALFTRNDLCFRSLLCDISARYSCPEPLKMRKSKPCEKIEMLSHICTCRGTSTTSLPTQK